MFGVCLKGEFVRVCSAFGVSVCYVFGVSVWHVLGLYICLHVFRNLF